MNPIENLWEVLKSDIHSQPITTKNELIEPVIKVWFHDEKNHKTQQNIDRKHAKQNKSLEKTSKILKNYFNVYLFYFSEFLKRFLR